MYKTAISYTTLITNVDIPDSVNSAPAEPPAVAVVAAAAAGHAPPHTAAAEPAAEPDVAAAVPKSRLSLQADQIHAHYQTYLGHQGLQLLRRDASLLHLQVVMRNVLSVQHRVHRDALDRLAGNRRRPGNCSVRWTRGR